MKHRPNEMDWFFLVIILLAMLWCLSGCSTAPTTQVPAKPTYDLTLKMNVDGQDYPDGVAMTSTATKHTIMITSQYDVNYFIAQSCHRYFKAEDVVTQGWIADKKSWSWTYDQAPGLETTGDCPFRLCVYSKTVGAPPAECGFVDSLNARYTLPAQNICNGVAPTNHGKMTCKTKAGLVERVQFPGSVIMADPLPTPTNGDPTQTYLIKDQCQGHFLDAANTLFEYIVPEKECYAIFSEIVPPYRRGKLTVIPFDEPLYSGVAK